jgi:hypothetical protein
MLGYLKRIGMDDRTARGLLQGEMPRGVGVGFSWVTEAALYSSGHFQVFVDEVVSGGMLTHFPAPPSTEAGRTAYYRELRAAMTETGKAVADLERVERIARDYGLPIKRRWLEGKAT